MLFKKADAADDRDDEGRQCRSLAPSLAVTNAQGARLR